MGREGLSLPLHMLYRPCSVCHPGGKCTLESPPGTWVSQKAA